MIKTLTDRKVESMIGYTYKVELNGHTTEVVFVKTLKDTVYAEYVDYFDYAKKYCFVLLKEYPIITIIEINDFIRQYDNCSQIQTLTRVKKPRILKEQLQSIYDSTPRADELMYCRKYHDEVKVSRGKFLEFDPYCSLARYGDDKTKQKLTGSEFYREYNKTGIPKKSCFDLVPLSVQGYNEFDFLKDYNESYLKSFWVKDMRFEEHISITKRNVKDVTIPYNLSLNVKYAVTSYWAENNRIVGYYIKVLDKQHYIPYEFTHLYDIEYGNQESLENIVKESILEAGVTATRLIVVEEMMDKTIAKLIEVDSKLASLALELSTLKEWARKEISVIKSDICRLTTKVHNLTPEPEYVYHTVMIGDRTFKVKGPAPEPEREYFPKPYSTETHRDRHGGFPSSK